MTTPNTSAKPRFRADQDSMTAWVMAHKREVTWAVVALLVIAGGLWFFQRSRTLKAQRAESAYFNARRSAAAGNLPLAISDLRNVAKRYEGTRAGTQAALSLAQALYDQQKFKEGIDELKKVEGKGPDDFSASVHVLEADGYQGLKDFTSAAAQYKAAADAARFPAEKAQYRASEARAYMAAGKLAEAKAIWEELAKDETGPEANEARVRLGEVSAQPMKI
jgi:predicted negative regulator of RcsB-dependent stress response